MTILHKLSDAPALARLMAFHLCPPDDLGVWLTEATRCLVIMTDFDASEDVLNLSCQGFGSAPDAQPEFMTHAVQVKQSVICTAEDGYTINPSIDNFSIDPQ